MKNHHPIQTRHLTVRRVPSNLLARLRSAVCSTAILLASVSGALAAPAPLELISGSVNGQLRSLDNKAELEVQPYSVGTAQLQSYFNQTLAENYRQDMTIYARLTASPSPNSYTVTHTSHLRFYYSYDVEFDDLFVFRFAPTAEEPAGTPKLVKITALGYSSNLWNGFGGLQGIGENSYGELLAPSVVSDVDGKPSAFKVTVQDHVMDITRETTVQTHTFQVNVGESFSVDVDLLAIASGRGSWKGVTASVTIAEVPKVPLPHGLKNQIPDSEYQALISLYHSLGGPGWTNKTGWLDPDADEWFGVSVKDLGTGEGTVDDLDLSSNQLNSRIPSSIQDLPNLDSLNLSRNDIVGPLPSELGSLSNLTTLDLSHNSITGSIPPWIGDLAKLETLALGRNHLSGELPETLANLNSIHVLDLSRNTLSGPFPDCIRGMERIKFLNLERNFFSGILPQWLSLEGFFSLRLANNRFSGLLPRDENNEPDLFVSYELTLYNNYFSEIGWDPAAGETADDAYLRFLRESWGTTVVSSPQLASGKIHVLSIGIDYEDGLSGGFLATKVYEGFGDQEKWPDVGNRALVTFSESSGEDPSLFRNAIIQAIQGFSSDLAPGDKLVVYLNGHGATIPSFTGQQEDPESMVVAMANGSVTQFDPANTDSEAIVIKSSGYSPGYFEENDLVGAFSDPIWEDVHKVFFMDTCFGGSWWNPIQNLEPASIVSPAQPGNWVSAWYDSEGTAERGIPTYNSTFGRSLVRQIRSDRYSRQSLNILVNGISATVVTYQSGYISTTQGFPQSIIPSENSPGEMVPFSSEFFVAQSSDFRFDMSATATLDPPTAAPPTDDGARRLALLRQIKKLGKALRKAKRVKKTAKVKKLSRTISRLRVELRGL